MKKYCYAKIPITFTSGKWKKILLYLVTFPFILDIYNVSSFIKGEIFWLSICNKYFIGCWIFHEVNAIKHTTVCHCPIIKEFKIHVMILRLINLISNQKLYFYNEWHSLQSVQSRDQTSLTKIQHGMENLKMFYIWMYLTCTPLSNSVLV